MKTALVTGFEPYGKFKVNPASECVKKLRGVRICGVKIIAKQVPVDFRKIHGVVERLLRIKPDVVVSLDLSPGSPSLKIERVAINLMDVKTPDNSGYRPRDCRIVRDGPPPYFLTLPARKLVKEINGVGIPAKVSNYAGTNLCNCISYLFRYNIEKRGLKTKSGFIHLPCRPIQNIKKPERPSMNLETMVKGIKRAIGVAV